MKRENNRKDKLAKDCPPEDYEKLKRLLMTKQKQETTRRTSATYRRSQAEKGLVQIVVWVPAETAEIVKDYAKAVKTEWEQRKSPNLSKGA